MEQNYVKLVSPAQAQKIRDAAVRILLGHGFSIRHGGLLGKVRQLGLEADEATGRVTLTEAIIEAMEDAARRNGKKPEREAYMRRPPSASYRFVRDIVHIVDERTGTMRQAVRADNQRFFKAAQMLPDIGEAGAIFTACDLPRQTEMLTSLADALRTTTKPLPEPDLVFGNQLPYLEELLTIRAGSQQRVDSSFASITRFTLDERASDCLWAVQARNGIQTWGSNSCVFPGLNGPLTLAGAAAAAMAEMLGGWLPGYACNPEVALWCIPVSGTLDMRTTRMMFSTPVAVLLDALLYQVFDLLYGVDTWPPTAATYVDAKVPGTRALEDKTFKTLGLFAYTGCPVGVHFGMLQGGAAISPAQILLDIELNRRLEGLTEGVEESDEALLLEEVLALGPGGDFLQTDYTLDHYRSFLFAPRYADFTAFTGEDEAGERQKDEAAVALAAADYIAAANRYEAPGLPPEVEKAVDAVEQAARRQLLER